MKIALYGTPKSGKKHLITHLVNHFKPLGLSAIHLPAAITLNALSEKRYRKKFSQPT